MKKILALAITVMSANSFLYSQTVKVQAGYFNSRLVWNSSVPEMDFSNTYEHPVHAIRPYVSIDFFEKKYYALSAGAGLTSKGGEQKFTTDPHVFTTGINTNWNSDIRLDYLSVNFAVEFRYPIRNNLLVPFVSAGPRFDYLVGWKQEKNPFMQEISPNSFVLGANLGGGLKFNYKKMQLGVRGDYLFSFTPVDKLSDRSGGNRNIKDRTYALSFFAGYRFRR